MSGGPNKFSRSANTFLFSCALPKERVGLLKEVIAVDTIEIPCTQISEREREYHSRRRFELQPF